MSYRISVYEDKTGEDVIAPLFEQRVETLDLKALFEAVNRKPRKPRTKKDGQDGKGPAA